jgi:hypothetical protein
MSKRIGKPRAEQTPNEEADDFDLSTFITAPDLLAEPDEKVDWVVDGLLPAGGLSVLAGKPKVGKSVLARYIASRVALGKRCLGRKTVGGPVLYITLEGRRQDVRAHLRVLRAGSLPQLYVHVGPVPQTPTGTSREKIREHRLAWLAAAIKKHRPVLIIIDTWGRFVTVKDSNDYAEGTAASEGVINLAQRTGVHFLFTHHSPKHTKRELIDSLLGSTAIAGAVDTVLLLRRQRDDVRTLATNQRVGDELPETVLILDPATGRLSLGGTRDEARQALMLQRILGYLRRVVSATEREILDAVRGDTERLKAALRAGVERELICRRGAGKRGDPYRYSLRKKKTTSPEDHFSEDRNVDCSSSASG